jgi:hypothetical protein
MVVPVRFVHAQAEMLASVGFFLGDAETDGLGWGYLPKAVQHAIYAQIKG